MAPMKSFTIDVIARDAMVAGSIIAVVGIIAFLGHPAQCDKIGLLNWIGLVERMANSDTLSKICRPPAWFIVVGLSGVVSGSFLSIYFRLTQIHILLAKIAKGSDA